MTYGFRGVILEKDSQVDSRCHFLKGISDETLLFLFYRALEIGSRRFETVLTFFIMTILQSFSFP